MEHTPDENGLHRLSLLPRWMHATYALTLGYFWLPCPDCGRMIGGHEDWRGVKPTDKPGVCTGVCRDCAQAYTTRPIPPAEPRDG